MKQQCEAKAQKAMTNSFRLLISFLMPCLFFLLSTFFTTPVAANAEKKILILNSYHPGYIWSDDIVSGVQSEMAEYQKEYELYIEYMDTQRYFDDSYLRILYETYKHKYKDVAFDVIISGDDNALNFLIKYRDDLFPGVPIVFCGVNRFSKSLIKDIDAITGVIEKIDIKATIDLILKIQPKTQEIAVIHDQSSSAQGNYEQFQEISSQYEGRINFKEITNVTFLELHQILKTLPENTALLYLLFLTDREGTVLSKEKILELISDGSNRPIYSCWGQEVNIGVTGGVVVSGVSQGQVATRMAKKILAGESAKDIPIVMESPNVVMFDNAKVENFGIDSSLIPAGSILLNKQISFYEKYKIYILIVLLVILVLFFCVIILYLNIQKRKQTEKLLKTSESFLDSVVENIPNMIFVKDARDLSFIRFNKAGEELLGYKRESLIGKNDYDFFTKEEADFFTDKDRKVLESKKLLDIPEEAMKTENNETRILHTQKIPILDNAGEPSFLLGISEDITDKIKALEEKAHLESQLLQAHKMEAIGTLAGGIAHDFNNILSVIFGYAEMAKGDSPPGSQFEQYLDQVLDAANRAKDLVKQILAFSRQAKAERISLQLQSLIKEAIKMLRSSIPTTIEIQDNIDSNCGVVLADPTQIHQIIMNLCTNANHAMEKTGGLLKIELQNITLDSTNKLKVDLAPGQYVRLTISDTGSGIDPDIIDKIFDPYFTTKEIGKGTGMGLAITHGIVADYGGAITVESKLGEGTTFHLYFPVSEQEMLAPDKEEEYIPSGSARVLFVDDEKILAQMGKDILERLGYKATTRCSSLDALATFQNAPDSFDVVITDQTMPGMTGADLARRILQIRPDIPIILCTGYSNLVDEHTAKMIGIKEFALKPLTKAVISKLIRKVLESKQCDESTHKMNCHCMLRILWKRKNFL